MNRRLTFGEIIIYGVLFSIFTLALVYLILLEPDMPVTEGSYVYNTDIVDEDVVSIGVLSDEEFKDVDWDALTSYLNQKIPNHTFEIVITNEQALQQQAQSGQYDFLIVDPMLYVQFEVDLNTSALLTYMAPVADNLLPVIGGVIFTNNSSPITKLDEIPNYKIATTTTTDFASWYTIVKEIRDIDYSASKRFDDIVLLSTPQEVLDKVLTNQVDVGFVRAGFLENAISDGLLQLNDIKIVNENTQISSLILSTRPYPGFVLAKTNYVSDLLASRISDALLELQPNNNTGTYWTIAQNYQDVHNVLKQLNLSPYETYNEISFKQTIYQNKLLFIVFIVFLFVFANFIFWVSHARKDLVEMTKQAIRMEPPSKQTKQRANFLLICHTKLEHQ